MQLGFIGLGKMGSRMVLKLLEGGHEVVVWNRSLDTVENFKFQITNDQLKQKLTVARTIEGVVSQLESPRIIWSMLPAGDATEAALQEVEKFATKDDIMIDGGNAHYADTQRRFEHFEKKHIPFLGIGVSGGVHGFENGFAMMAGGDRAGYETIRPILETLAKPHATASYVGTGGAGHFAKMVHNAIEYGIMQALGEGFGILEKAPYPFDLRQVAQMYRNGTIISGFLMDCAADALAKDERLSDITGVIAESGEARWAVEAAKAENVPHEIIEGSLEFRRKSKKEKTIQTSFAAKLIAAIRHEFGGHEVKKTTP